MVLLPKHNSRNQMINILMATMCLVLISIVIAIGVIIVVEMIEKASQWQD